MPTMLFGELLHEWWERYLFVRNPRYARESWRRLEKEVLPDLGDKQPKKITPPMILNILRRIEARGTIVAARKIKCHISQAMRYGIACGFVTSDPTRDLSFALMPHRSIPRAALTEPSAIGKLMAKLETYTPRQSALALKLAALTFVRPGEIAAGAWAEVSWENALWKIPAEKMKMKRPHVVPLAKQTLEVLRELHTLTGDTPHFFPSRKDRRNAEKPRCLGWALQRMGYDGNTLTPHGFRAMAATTPSEQGWPSEVIERQLAHIDKNAVQPPISAVSLWRIAVR